MTSKKTDKRRAKSVVRTWRIIVLEFDEMRAITANCGFSQEMFDRRDNSSVNVCLGSTDVLVPSPKEVRYFGQSRPTAPDVAYFLGNGRSDDTA